MTQSEQSASQPGVPAETSSLGEPPSLLEDLANQILLVSYMVQRILQGGKWDKQGAIVDLQITTEGLRQRLPNHYPAASKPGV